MQRVLVAASPIYGHFNPLRMVAEHLAEVGYQVTVLCHESFRGAIRSPKARFVQFTGQAATDPDAVIYSERRLSIPPGPERRDWDLRHVFLEPMAAQHRDVQRIIGQADGEPVLLVYETMFFGAVPSLLGADGPRPSAALGLGPVSFTLSSRDTAPFGMGLPPAVDKEGRARNRDAYALIRRELGPLQDLFEQTLADLGTAPSPAPFFLDSTIQAPDAFLQMSIEELSYRRSDTPAHVRFVGALPTPPETAALPEWWADLDKAGRVIAVTQGTLANRDFSELIEPTLEGLSDFPGIVVAATGRDGLPRVTPANARIAPYIPFGALLPRTEALVTNGGFGAVQQALGFGKPLVVAGLSEEKRENNVRVAATGAAIDLATNRPSPAEVRDAVESLTSTPSYRENAERLALEYAKHDALAEIEATVADLTG